MLEPSADRIMGYIIELYGNDSFRSLAAYKALVELKTE